MTWSLHVLPACVWALIEVSSFLQQLKTMHVRVNWKLHIDGRCVFECELLFVSSWPCDELASCQNPNPTQNSFINPQGKLLFVAATAPYSQA